MTHTWPSAVAEGWHPVAALSELRGKPLARRLLGRPLVVFRGEGGVGVMRDCCPHRAMPLSAGRLRGGTIECAYHGWRFAADGRCVAVPGSPSVPNVSAPVLPVVNRAGLVWTSLAPRPAPFPELPDVLEAGELDRFWWLLQASPAGLVDAIENHLDPAHPHFVHPWLVRGPSRRRPVRVTVRSGPWGAEATYHEEAKPGALLPLFLGGTTMRGSGRFHPPTTATVRFDSESGLLLAITVVFAPEAEGLVRPWAHFATRRRILPAWLKRLGLKGAHVPVLAQDRRMLARQAASRAEAGGQADAMGPLDLLGPSIRRLVQGVPEPEQSSETILML